MGELIASVIGALAAGALAKAGDIGGHTVTDAYDALRELIVRKLGKDDAVQNVEDEPRSEAAQKALAEELADLAPDPELGRHTEALRAAVAIGGADIEIGAIVAKVNVLVNNLIATGTIKLGELRAREGDITLTNLMAGGPKKKRERGGQPPLPKTEVSPADPDLKIQIGEVVAGKNVNFFPGTQRRERDVPEVTREALDALRDLDNEVRKTIAPLTRFHKNWSEDQKRQAIADVQRLSDKEKILPKVRRLVAELELKLSKPGDLPEAVSAAADAVLNIGKTTLTALGGRQPSEVTPWKSARELACLLDAVEKATTDGMAQYVRDQAGKVVTIVDRRDLAEADELAGRLP
jgi:hypothetical protein